MELDINERSMDGVEIKIIEYEVLLEKNINKFEGSKNDKQVDQRKNKNPKELELRCNNQPTRCKPTTPYIYRPNFMFSSTLLAIAVSLTENLKSQKVSAERRS